MNLHIAGASKIYGAQRLLHNLRFCYIKLAASTVRSVTVDCNVKDLGCSNAAGVPVEMLQEDICQALLPIPAATRLFTANPCFFRKWKLPLFSIC